MLRLLLIGIVILVATDPGEFKKEQLRYPRVRKAYADKWDTINSLLRHHKLNPEKLRLYIRAFKRERQVEIWARSGSDVEYKNIITYQFCSSSGVLGPKRRQGDLQIPEGFYHIDRFNPYSAFYLSLGINYPNRSDQLLSNKQNPGGDIFIHGSCVTIGCIPITDACIKELYILCVEATNAGQKKIPVSIFPARLDRETYGILVNELGENNANLLLWRDLREAYQFFEEKQFPPDIQFLNSGRHRIK